MSVNIVEFLEARIAEDEDGAIGAQDHPADGPMERWEPAPARAADGYTVRRAGGVRVLPVATGIGPLRARHIARWDPTRVLAECAAKRAIVGLHHLERETYQSQSEAFGYGCDICAEDDGLIHGDGPCETLMALAAVYDQHPDYDPAWRP